jgi:hypothetical protein
VLESLADLKKYITLRTIQMSEITLEFKPEDTEAVDTEPLKAVTTSLKRAYTMSDSKRDQLAKARARALELRNSLNAIKPPKEKTVKIKPLSKMEIQISEIQAAKPIEPTPPEPEPEPVTIEPEPIEPGPVVLVKVKKQKEAPIKQQRKQPSLLVSTPTPPPPTPPIGFQRNSFGFYVL